MTYRIMLLVELTNIDEVVKRSVRYMPEKIV